MKVTTPSARSVVMGLGLVLVGALLVTPVRAHVKKEFGHLWKKHIKPKLSSPGTINKAKNPLNWAKLKNVPAGFADGTDDVAGGSGGGDITSVAAGSGLTGGGDSGEVSLGADLSAVQARVSGGCPPPGIPNPDPSDPDFGSSIKAIKADGTVICDEDDVGPEDVEIVVKHSSSNSVSFKAVVATCPPPKIAISGGGSIGGGVGAGLALLGSYPSEGNKWFAIGHEAVPTDQTWVMTAVAVCAAP